MDAQLKIAKAAFVPGLLSAAGVLLARMFAPSSNFAQLVAAAIGGIGGAIVAANLNK